MVKLLQLRTIDFEIHYEALKIDGGSRIGISSQVAEDDTQENRLTGRTTFEIYKMDDEKKVPTISFRCAYFLETQPPVDDDEPFDAVYPVIVARIQNTMQALGYRPLELPPLEAIKANLQSDKDAAKDEELWS